MSAVLAARAAYEEKVEDLVLLNSAAEEVVLGSWSSGFDPRCISEPSAEKKVCVSVAGSCYASLFKGWFEQLIAAVFSEISETFMLTCLLLAVLEL